MGKLGLQCSQWWTTCPAVCLGVQLCLSQRRTFLRLVRRYTASKWGVVLTPKSRPALFNVIVTCQMRTILRQNISISAKTSIGLCRHTVHKKRCRKKCCHFSIKMEEALFYQMGSPESSVILESALNLTRCIKKNVNIKTSNYNKLIANPSCSPCFLTFNTLKPNTWKHWDVLCSLKRKRVLITYSSIILSSENSLEKSIFNFISNPSQSVPKSVNQYVL